MNFNKFKLGTIACVLLSAVLITGCNQTVSDIDNSSETENVSKQLAMLTSSPDFKQTTIDEVKYITTHKIGKVTYIVHSSASPKATETLEKKIEKMIKKDAAQN